MTPHEIYFLVRVGSWSEDDLARYIDDQIEMGHDRYYDKGYEDGVKDGYEDGQNDMYRQAVEAVRCLK